MAPNPQCLPSSSLWVGSMCSQGLSAAGRALALGFCQGGSSHGERVFSGGDWVAGWGVTPQQLIP